MHPCSWSPGWFINFPGRWTGFFVLVCLVFSNQDLLALSNSYYMVYSMGGTSCLSWALLGVIAGKAKEHNLAIAHREWKIKGKCQTPNNVWLLLITN